MFRSIINTAFQKPDNKITQNIEIKEEEIEKK